MHNRRCNAAKNSRKDRAILAVMEHPTLEKAAAAVGVHPSTLRRWLREPEFQEKLAQASHDKLSQSLRLLLLGAPAAVSHLMKLMRDPEQPGSTQVRAIDTLLNRVTKLIEMEGLVVRLTKLERIVDPKPEYGPSIGETIRAARQLQLAQQRGADTNGPPAESADETVPQKNSAEEDDEPSEEAA